MSIRWDSLLVRHLAGELDASLSGARLRALRLDARSRDLVLLFRDRTLAWSLHPDRAAPILVDAVDPQEGDIRLKARVRGVRAPVDERILLMELAGERSGQGPWELVVELMGNQLNALVTEGTERTVRHLLRRRDGKRPAEVGRPYLPPAPTGREGADGELSAERWLELLEAVPPPQRARELVRTVAWTSPINAESFLGAEAGPDDSTGPDLVAGHLRWKSLSAGTEPVAPGLLDTDRGLQPYPFEVTGVGREATPSLLAAFERCARLAGSADDTLGALSVGPELLHRLEDAVAQAERRCVRLEAQLESREEPTALRAVGDLILARFDAVRPGASTVTLTGFDGEPVEIDLDPKLAPHENASRFYDRASRSERAAERLPGLIERAAGARDRLSELLEAAKAGEADADSVRAALPDTVRRRNVDAAPALPYRTFRSSGGLEIRVGRGAKHNDALTFHHSAPNDVWMHARHVAGAHVVLRWPHAGAPPARDLQEAGVLAALHSKARTSASVPVDWTLRKYVRKPRGAAPGSVVPDRVQTVFVDPDELLLDRLAVEE